MIHRKEKYHKYQIILSLLFLLMIIGTINVFAKENQVYKEGIYRYKITNEAKREVQMIGIEPSTNTDVITIPGKVIINDKEYTITKILVSNQSIDYHKYISSYDNITKVIVENYIGEFNLPIILKNVKYIEFNGDEIPKDIVVYLWQGMDNYDFVFKVPKGKEAAYKEKIYLSMELNYDGEIELEPVIITSDLDIVEQKIFTKDNFIYQVTKSAVSGNGEVQLVGTKILKASGYIKLPEKTTYNNYQYQLTKLANISLLYSRAKIVHIPDTVRELEQSVFSGNVELIFLSKNIKVIPKHIISDENNTSNLKFVYVPEGIEKIEENAFDYNMVNNASIILPKSIQSVGNNSLYGFKLVTFLNDKPIDHIASAIKNGTTVKVSKSSFSAYRKLLNTKILIEEAKSIVKSTSITMNKKSVNTNTSKTTTLIGTLTKGSNETIYWLSSDTNIFDISSKGVINPKKAGTAYAVAYTRTSGLHQAIKVTVTDAIFTDGIYTYKVTDAAKKTVTLMEVKPTSSTKKLTIPETAIYNKNSYKVISVVADSNDTSLPLIKDKYQNNKITEVIFPKSVTGIVGYMGKMKNIKSITFKGSKAPECINNWFEDDSLLAFQSMIYVPKGTVDQYKSAMVTLSWSGAYFTRNYSCDMVFNIVETGTTQRQWFIKDGILYRVTKKAGSKSGTVTVHGADVKLKAINVGGTIKDGKYSYSVTAVNHNAFLQSYAESITLKSTITKVGTRVFNQRVKMIVWSKNAKTIETYLFGPSMDLYEKYHSVEIDNMIKKGEFYALTSFVIPEGVTTIGNVFRYGFENVKTLTIPKSATKIGKYAFDSIQKVEYVKK